MNDKVCANFTLHLTSIHQIMQDLETSTENVSFGRVDTVVKDTAMRLANFIQGYTVYRTVIQGAQNVNTAIL